MLRAGDHEFWKASIGSKAVVQKVVENVSESVELKWGAGSALLRDRKEEGVLRAGYTVMETRLLEELAQDYAPLRGQKASKG